MYKMVMLLTVLFVMFVVSESLSFEKWVAERTLIISGAAGSNFRQPSDVAVYDRKIYVLDSMNNRVCIFDSRGRQIEVITGTSNSSMVGAMGLANDARGRFFIADGSRGRILTFKDSDKPAVLMTLDNQKEGADPDPTDVLFFGESLYVVDNDNHKISFFQIDGEKKGDWGGLGEGYARFSYPFRIAVDPEGRIGITDVLNYRVQFFTPKGRFLSGFGKPGVVSGTLYRPAGFDIDENGNIYLSDNYFGTVQVFDISGNLTALLYGIDGKPLTLSSPVALKVQRGTLYAVEMAADRVSVFSLKR